VDLGGTIGLIKVADGDFGGIRLGHGGDAVELPDTPDGVDAGAEPGVVRSAVLIPVVFGKKRPGDPQVSINRIEIVVEKKELSVILNPGTA
jgi:hypothetical protein